MVGSDPRVVPTHKQRNAIPSIGDTSIGALKRISVVRAECVHRKRGDLKFPPKAMAETDVSGTASGSKKATRILTDTARAHGAAKRGGPVSAEPLDLNQLPSPDS